MTQTRNFGADSTTDDVLEGIDLSGKQVVITGGSSGLGEETARAMAAKGAHLILPVRDKAKGQAAADKIKAAHPGAQVDVLQLDLGSQDSVRSFAKDFLAQYDRIDLLINNAGVMACPFEKTADGLEMQFGTNHIGHFLMTNLLMPALLNGAPARIVNLSSRGHHVGAVGFDDVNFTTRPYNKWEAYGQAKTANVLFSVGLEKRLADKGIHSYAVHPGVIMTNLGRHLDEDDIAYMQERIKTNSQSGSGLKTEAQGAATSCYAATAPELEGKGGIYLEDCHLADIEEESTVSGVRPYAIDADNAERLWALSEEIVGQSF